MHQLALNVEEESAAEDEGKGGGVCVMVVAVGG